jgi:hypothetical protein
MTLRGELPSFPSDDLLIERGFTLKDDWDKHSTQITSVVYATRDDFEVRICKGPISVVWTYWTIRKKDLSVEITKEGCVNKYCAPCQSTEYDIYLMAALQEAEHLGITEVEDPLPYWLTIEVQKDRGFNQPNFNQRNYVYAPFIPTGYALPNTNAPNIITTK